MQLKLPIQKLNFPHSMVGSKDLDQQSIQYDFLCHRLKQILQALTIDKAMMEHKIENERSELKREIQAKQQRIKQLESENEVLRKQVLSEQTKNVSQVAYLKKKNAKLQLQRDSLANIIHYLQLKSKQLNQELYQLKKNKNRRLTQASSNLSNIYFPAQYFAQRQGLFQQGQQFILPKNIYKTESSQVSLTAIKNKDDESERITKKIMASDQKKSLLALERIRSFGQIDETTRDAVVKAEKKHAKNQNGKELTSKKDQNRRMKIYEQKMVSAKKVKRFDSS